jgi:hypothetical protein
MKEEYTTIPIFVSTKERLIEYKQHAGYDTFDELVSSILDFIDEEMKK